MKTGPELTGVVSATRGTPGSWWAGQVGYQIYLRSFADGDGDGIGDLRGLLERLDHLADLGVDYLWITPFYPSPQADHGYDVADYTAVDPVYGELGDLDAVLAGAHDRALRVVIDIVPNHTSDAHPWFRAALTGRESPQRGYYVWRDPAPGGGPPNNWVSKFGGPAWTLHAATGQYYMHTFLAEQPDLNWANPAVRAEFDAILRFWLARGVDGFRIDTAHLLTEDPDFRDNPERHPVAPGADPEAVYDAYEHRHDLDQPDVLEIYRHWQRVVGPGVLLLGEVGLFEAEPVGRYVADGALDLAFYFPTLKTGWDPHAIRDMLERALEAGGDRFAWPLSSHDDPRATQRFGGGRRGADRSLAYLTLLCGLPGSVFLLQGDELGLDGSGLDPSDLRDPVASRHPGAGGRDSSRTPMPWRPGDGFGFSSAKPWLPFPARTTDTATVAHQRHTPTSHLRRTRELFATRRTLADLTGDRPLRWLPAPGPVVAFRRGGTVVAMNTERTAQVLDLDDLGDVRYRSDADGATLASNGTLPPEATVIFSRAAPRPRSTPGRDDPVLERAGPHLGRVTGVRKVEMQDRRGDDGCS